MMRTRLHKRTASALMCAFRMLIVFTLAFSGTYGVQQALADDANAGTAPSAVQAADGAGAGGGSGSKGNPDSGGNADGQPGGDSGSSSSGASPTGSGSSTNVHIVDLGIYKKPKDVYDKIDVVAFSTAGIPEAHQEITENGGSIDFDVRAYWNDASEDDDWRYVTWSLEPGDESVASITRDTGILQARGGVNGTVTVTATLNAGYTEDGSDMKVQLLVDISGQQDVPYVTNIVICDDAGVPIDPSYTFHDASLSTAMIELQAKVTVFDPAGQVEAVYQVKPGAGLSKQTDGKLADLEWGSVESSMGVVSEDGIYRPLREAANVVYAVSGAGKDNNPVVASATIIMPGEGEAHPQDSLTVDVVWEAYPDQVVASKTFSVGDLEALGTHTLSYTAFGGGTFGFMTFTGRGPYLVDVLHAAGVDTDGVSELLIESFDNPYVVSWDLLVGKDRFYFPNMDIGSEAEAVQVAPMLALESMRAPLGSSDPVPYEQLTTDDRFRLLFGAGMGDEGVTTTSMQRYWIHTIHVVLGGAPPVQPDEPEQPDEPDDPEKPDEPRTTPAVIPGGGDPTVSGGGGDNAGTPTQPQAASSRANAADQSDDSAPSGRHNQGAWSVLQSVNKNDSNVEGLDLDNPFGPFTGALGFGFLAAGGVEAFVRFRWETRLPFINWNGGAE